MISKSATLAWLFAAAASFAQPPLPEAAGILSFARAQLPARPVQMSGTLQQRAANGYLKKTMAVEMDLKWGADPAEAVYRLRDGKDGRERTLNIRWKPGGPEFSYNGAAGSFDPDAEIDDLGVTWADLSFAFLWNHEAQTEGTGKKLGKDCFIVAIPRPGGHRLRIWVEQETGRIFGAREENAAGDLIKEIKVVSVKEFDGLWMVKDLDIIRPGNGGRTSLRVDTVTAAAE